MRSLIILFLFISTLTYSQNTRTLVRELLSNNAILPPPNTKNFTLDTIPLNGATNDFQRPGAGGNTFYTFRQDVKYPDSTVASTLTPWGIDNDTRYLWYELNPNTAGVYVWTHLDNDLNTTIARGGRKFSFSIMPVSTGDPTNGTAPGGGVLGYPQYIHTQMQAEGTKDWLYSGTNQWIPNWNSPSYIAGVRAFLIALNNHLNTTSSPTGVPYRNVILHISIGMFGNYGEYQNTPWRDCGCIPAGTTATGATIQSIIDAHVTAFPNFQLVLVVNVFGGEVPTSASCYATTLSNNVGPLGWKSYHAGSDEQYTFDMTNLNPRFCVNVNDSLRHIILNRYKTAPVRGEPLQFAGGVSANGTQPNYYALKQQSQLFGMSQITNGNIVTPTVVSTTAMVRQGMKYSGYRWAIKGGTVSNNISNGQNIQLTLDASNIGNAPIYENWNLRIDIRNAAGTVLWFAQSAFVIRLKLPGVYSFTDTYTGIPALAAGTYSINAMWIDPNGYRNPLPLANTLQRADGSYQLTTITHL